MFGKSNKSNTSAPQPKSTSSNAINSIVAGTKITGDIHASNDFRVDGEIDGTIHCQGKLIIGQDGSIKGEVQCKQAVVEGKFQGKLNVSDILNVKASAYIEGEVRTGQLNVEPGGVINGSCEMGSTQKIKSIKNVDPPKSKVGS